MVIGIVIPLVISKISGDDGMKFRTKSGELSSFVLDSLRGLNEIIQYGLGTKRLQEMNERTDALSIDEERMKKITGRNMAATNAVILMCDLTMLLVSVMLYQNGSVAFEGVLIPTIAFMSFFGPCVALAFIMSLPQGYDTAVGELGDTLSGGERQRIGLARAFLHNAPFMLLDEPTSNLDSLNEAVILKSLHEERQDKTVVLVSHRQSTMRIADTVYAVEHGRMS